MLDNNALHTAAKAGDLAQVQSQVSNFDINAKGEDDETALVKAAQNGYSEVFKLLLTLSADVNIPDVSTLKMIPVHLIYVFPLPSYLCYTILSIHLGMYCHYSNPVTLSRYTAFSVTHDIQYYYSL